MQSLTKHYFSRVFIFGVSLAGCSSTPPAPPVYTAEQLNAAAIPALPDDSLGPPSTSDQGASPSPGSGPSEPPPPSNAALRVIHASPDRATASVSVFVDDSEVAAVQSIAYRSIAGAVQVSAAEHHLRVRPAAAAAGSAPTLDATTPPLDADQRYTAVVHGLVGAVPRLGVTVGRDDVHAPEAGKARLRFFHALVGTGAVDVCTAPVAARPAVPAAGQRAAQQAQAARPAQAVFTNVAYGAFGEYVDVNAGTATTLQLRAQNARPCAGLLRGTVTLTAAEAQVLTAVAIGRPAAAPPVARQLLVCVDAPTEGPPSCAPSPIR